MGFASPEVWTDTLDGGSLFHPTFNPPFSLEQAATRLPSQQAPARGILAWPSPAGLSKTRRSNPPTLNAGVTRTRAILQANSARELTDQGAR